jgi:hypothetical protein
VCARPAFGVRGGTAGACGVIFPLRRPLRRYGGTSYTAGEERYVRPPNSKTIWK